MILWIAVPTGPSPLTAWTFSLLFHTFVIGLLALAVEHRLRGAGDRFDRSAGIVLDTTSAAGDLDEGADDQSKITLAAANFPPTDVLSALPIEPLAITGGIATPQVPVPAPVVRTGGAGELARDIAERLQASGSSSAQQRGAGQKGSASGRRGSPFGDSTARVSVFGVEGTGNKFVYLFDHSASMEDAPLAAAKRQLIESLQSLDSVHQFHIIFFNSSTQSFDITGGSHRIAFATETNKKMAERFVLGVTATGGTDRLLALREAITLSPDVIFFLTDADDPMPPSELAAIAQANRRAGAAICVIEFGSGPMPKLGNFLSEIARQNGGHYGYVNTATLPR